MASRMVKVWPGLVLMPSSETPHDLLLYVNRGARSTLQADGLQVVDRSHVAGCHLFQSQLRALTRVGDVVHEFRDVSRIPVGFVQRLPEEQACQGFLTH